MRTRSMNAHAPASTDFLDPVIAALRGAPDAARLERFARDFLARLPQDELESRPASDWAAIVRSFVAFAAQRAPGAPKIAVANPDPAVDGFDTTHTVVRIVNDDMPFLVDSVRMALAQHELA